MSAAVVSLDAKRAEMLQRIRPHIEEARAACNLVPEREAWWASLDSVDRRYLVHKAKLPKTHAELNWESLATFERGRVLAAIEDARAKFNDNRRGLL